jgi:hypothetical protein
MLSYTHSWIFYIIKTARDIFVVYTIWFILGPLKAYLFLLETNEPIMEGITSEHIYSKKPRYNLSESVQLQASAYRVFIRC